MAHKLNDNDLTQTIENLEGWTRVSDRHAIEKQFKFKDFAQAWSFMNQVAELAEQMDHHPEWSNVYNKVDITLTTHDVGGVSEKDIDMAGTINKYEEQTKSG